MFTIDGLIWMLLAVVLVFAAIQQAGDGKKQMSDRTHRMVCCAALAVGVLVRLVKLSSLPPESARRRRSSACRPNRCGRRAVFFLDKV